MRSTPYRWPEGRSCGAVLSFDFDAESPYLWHHRDALGNSLAELEQRRFGPRQGVYRILDLLAAFHLRASFYIPGWVVDRHPRAVQAVAEAGHELALHGYLHERVDQLDATQVEATLVRSLEAFQRAGLPKPTGFRSPSWEMTPDLLQALQKFGLEYDSSLMGYDHPYWIGGLVEVPVQWMLDDAPYYRYVGRGETRAPATPTSVVEGWAQELEGIKRFGGLFMLTMHPWISGRGGRLLALERLLEGQRHEAAIWWTTAVELATHHRSAHPTDYREMPSTGEDAS